MGKVDEERLAIGVKKTHVYMIKRYQHFIIKMYLHCPLCQALLMKLEHIFSSFSTRVRPL